MQYHKLTEHFDEKPFSCEECGAKFAANSTLKNHLRLHTGDRPFMCKHCLMTFTQASALAYHTKKKHSEGEGHPSFSRRVPRGRGGRRATEAATVGREVKAEVTVFAQAVESFP